LTTTNFRRGSSQKSHLWIFDPSKEEIVSSIDTKGEWSKVIKIDHSRGIAYVSNWHSHDLSIVDISNPRNLRMIQLLACDESPRGLALRHDGVVVATSFYGRKIFSIKNVDGKYCVAKESTVFDQGKYGGNMRDIIITADGNTAWVSNLGRNMLHKYDARTLELLNSILVPREPNSIRFLDKTEKIILVSCRKDKVVCFVDTKEKRPIGVSQRTGKLPTGLVAVEAGFLVTSFSGTIELHKVRYC
jgi:DNA-binding beta-propeller fold protein YncE